MPAAVPLVSVVIPTYNRERLVVQAVRTVLAQDHPALEVLVVDDGSADGTLPRLAAFGPPVRRLARPHSGIAARVRNAGIREARGELLAFLDADDLWLPGKLARQLDHLARHPDLAVVYTDSFVEDGGRRRARTRFADCPPRARLYVRERLSGMCVQASTLLLRREVLDAVGLFDEALVMYEVSDLVSRISEVYPMGVVEEPLAVRRLGVDRLHVTLDDALRAREARKYLARYHARRDGATRDDEERDAARRFEAELAALEARLGTAP